MQVLHCEIQKADGDTDSVDAEACRDAVIFVVLAAGTLTETAEEVVGRAVVDLDPRPVERYRAAVRGGKRVEDGIDQRRLIRVASDRKGPEL